MDEGVPKAEAMVWLKEFASCVRERDLDAGRELFDQRCYSFGTRVSEAPDLDTLVESQWAPVWEGTTGFAIDDDSVHASMSADGTLVVLAARWSSVAASPRRGRCTFVLRYGADGLRAVHSHFSMDPRDDPDPGRLNS